MEQQEIQERNKQIALMLNIKIEQCYPENKDYKQHGIVYTLEKEFAENVNSIFLSVSKLKFHKDWRWLMEAVEFIGKQNYKGFPINCTIGSTGCSINVNPTNFMGDKFEGKREIVNTLNINYHIVDEKEEGFTKKEAVFIAVSDFAKKFNNKEL
jgi:hypothetical protein